MDVTGLPKFAVSTSDYEPLVGLGAVAQLRAEMERIEAVLVRRARNTGGTWPQIAAVMRVSQQTVHKNDGGPGLFGGRS
jgi:hypothetical protein